jgi:uncharacterized Rmd1/YagE family protein
MTAYQIHAYNLYDAIQIKQLRHVFSGKVTQASSRAMVVKYAEESYLFVFQFGCLVFFNVPEPISAQEKEKIEQVLGPPLKGSTSDSYVVSVGGAANKVEFESVEIKKLSLEFLELISRSVSQSAALEYFENQADDLLESTAKMMDTMAKVGTIPFQSRPMVRLIGRTAAARQKIISHLEILDPPETAWKNKEIERLYYELQENFDLEVRFRTLDRKLSLIQDNIEVLTNLGVGRRTVLLEAMIVILIVFEILMAFW